MEMADLENAAQSATAADTLLSATEQGSPGPSQGGALWRPFRQSLLRKARHLTTSFRRNLRPSRRGDETDEADLDNLAAAAAVEEPSVVDAAEALIQDGSRTRSDVTAVNGSRSHLAHAGFTNQPFQPVIDENAALVAQNLPQGDGSQILDTESGAMDLSLPRHKRIVIKMTDEEIATENKGRQEIRGIWRNGDIGDTSYIEDSWKSLWEENSEAEKGLFQWPCSDADRKSLQLDLVDALHSASVDEVWPGRGLRILSCWISLIGLRLNDLYLKHNYAEPGSEKRTDHPVILTRILLECIWTCNKSRPATVGDVLESCYRRHILLQPHNPHTSFETRYSNSILQDHIRAVRISIYLVSIVYKHEFPTANQMEDFESVWSTAISDTEIKMRPERPHVEVKSGKDPFVAVGDINLKDLQSIGQLRILWTPYWDEHFELQTLWTTNVLKLYWFSPRLSKYLISIGLCGGLEEHNWFNVTDEILSTISLILSSSSKSLEARLQYEQLEAPPWLALLAHPILKSWKPEKEPDGFEPPPVGDSLSKFRLDKEQLSYFRLNHDENVGDFWAFCLETADHMTTEWPAGRRLPHERLKISQFPFFHERLRELRVYMDSQQPRGLRELWKDKRNVNNFWTFWFVVIFGASSVFLAIGALVAGALGTWAQIKSLHGH